MLSMTVNENQNVIVTFDITGNGEGIICYYIREVKLTMKKQSERSNQDTVEKIAVVIKKLTKYVDYKESENEQIWILQPQKLIGFTSLAFFQPAIEMQYRELMPMLKIIEGEGNCPFQIEMVLDVIY